MCSQQTNLERKLNFQSQGNTRKFNFGKTPDPNFARANSEAVAEFRPSHCVAQLAGSVAQLIRHIVRLAKSRVYVSHNTVISAHMPSQNPNKSKILNMVLATNRIAGNSLEITSKSDLVIQYGKHC